MTKRVLLNDGMDKEGLALFEQAGIETDTSKRDLENLIREIPWFDGLCVRSTTKVTREVIEAGTKGKLKIIGRAGVGYDNVDVDAASENGIIVKIAPHGNTNSTAELTLGLMLAVSRNIPQAHSSLKNGVWQKKKFEGRELSGKTLGIIGCGKIGQRLAELTRGFGMPVIGYDPFADKVKELFPDSRIAYMDKDMVVSQTDYLSIHSGGKDEVIGARELVLMKPTAFIINTSRGKNINEEALYEALTTGKIAGAGLDVYVNEPKEEGGQFEKKFRELENVVLTSHLGASTKEAQRKTSLEMARVVIDYLLGKGDIFSGAVNVQERVEEESRKVYPLFVYHEDIPGAFAAIDNNIAGCNINIRENPSRTIGKDGNVLTVYLLHNQPTPALLSALKRIKIVHRAEY